MAFMVAEKNDVAIEDVGVSCTVPNNNIAKLMYYLSSLSSCLEGFIPTQYTDYSNFDGLSNAEKKEVVTLAALLSPDILLDKVIFGVDANNPILNGSANTFLKITNAQTVMAAATNLRETIIIGEKNVNVGKILIFTQNWIKKNYLDPLVAESYRLNASNQTGTGPKPTNTRPKQKFVQLDVEDNPYRRDRPSVTYTNSSSCCTCGCFFKFICVIVLLAAMAIAVLLPHFFIPNCNEFQQFVTCWQCMLVRNFTCTT